MTQIQWIAIKIQSQNVIPLQMSLSYLFVLHVRPCQFEAFEFIQSRGEFSQSLLIRPTIPQHHSNPLYLLIVYKHWPDTREFITQSGELWNRWIKLDCRVIITEYRICVHCIHMYHLFCNALVHVIYSGVSGPCSHTIVMKVSVLICTKHIN